MIYTFLLSDQTMMKNNINRVVWQTIKEVNDFIREQNFDQDVQIVGIEADWETETVKQAPGIAWRKLAVERPLVEVRQ